MNKKKDVTEWIKLSRGMGFFCIAIMIMFVAAGIILSPHGLVFSLICLPFGFLSTAFNTMSRVFRSQQSEIEDLKTAIERLQGAGHPAEAMSCTAGGPARIGWVAKRQDGSAMCVQSNN